MNVLRNVIQVQIVESHKKTPLVNIHLLFLWVLSAVLQASVIYDCKTTLKRNIILYVWYICFIELASKIYKQRLLHASTFFVQGEADLVRDVILSTTNLKLLFFTLWNVPNLGVGGQFW